MSYLEDSRENGDPVRPGEQWFFYWKTSAALWESRILQFPKTEIIFIPLYWGFHAESAAEWDFGRIQSERDLVRLVQLLTQHGRRFCWVLPLSPAPFFPNGGVPAFAARTLSIAREGVLMASLDRDQNLNKMLSFYEPKVYGAFTGFLRAFEAFLTEHQVQSPVWGAEFFYLEDGHKISFLEDWSVAFDHGFSRYVRQKFPTGTGLADESDLKTVFRSEVSSLFLQSAESVLTTYWMGKMPVTVLGSSPRDCIQRSMPSGKSQLSYTRELVHLYMHDQWISSSLLTNTEKKDLLPFILADQFSSSDAEEKFQFQLPRTDLTEEYRPFGVVEIFSKDESLRKMGLLKFLDDNYRSLYQFSDSFAFTNEWVQGSQHKIKLFQGGALDRLGFAQILKLFMLGQRILLDVQDLPLELDKRLQVFLIENNIKNQTLNFVTAISVFELGDGRLITFDGKKLIGKPEQKNFWHQIFKYFNLTQPEVTMDDDLFSFWKIRSTSGHELNYLDVRRVNFYNPTSYKKHVTINTKNHFAFLRAADSLRASAKSVSQRVEVELLPNGKISLDFGHYEEAPCR